MRNDNLEVFGSFLDDTIKEIKEEERYAKIREKFLDIGFSSSEADYMLNLYKGGDEVGIVANIFTHDLVKLYGETKDKFDIVYDKTHPALVVLTISFIMAFMILVFFSIPEITSLLVAAGLGAIWISYVISFTRRILDIPKVDEIELSYEKRSKILEKVTKERIYGLRAEIKGSIAKLETFKDFTNSNLEDKDIRDLKDLLKYDNSKLQKELMINIVRHYDLLGVNQNAIGIFRRLSLSEEITMLKDQGEVVLDLDEQPEEYIQLDEVEAKN